MGFPQHEHHMAKLHQRSVLINLVDSSSGLVLTSEKQGRGDDDFSSRIRSHTRPPNITHTSLDQDKILEEGTVLGGPEASVLEQLHARKAN